MYEKVVAKCVVVILILWMEINKVERRYVHIRCLWDSFKHTRLRQLLMPLDGIKF